jgi:hypothetical protein
MRFNWGTLASNVTYPLIKLKNGEYMALVDNATMFTQGITYLLPGNNTVILDQYAIGAANHGAIVTAGRISYHFHNDSTTTAVLDNITDSSNNLLTSRFPAILIMQEQDNSTNKDYVVIPLYGRDLTNHYIGVSAPTCSDGSFSLVQWASNIYKYSEVDMFGTYVTRTTPTNAGETVEVYYPDTQAVVTVGVGTSPAFAVGGAGTVEQAVKITQPVAKLASEVSSTAPASDLILIGGPCANALTAAVMAADNVSCGAWPYTTGIIKEYASAFTNGKKALVVAGTDADDTRNLAAMLIAGTYSYAT